MYIIYQPIVKPELNKILVELIKELKLIIIGLSIGYISNTVILIVLIWVLYFLNNLINPVFNQFAPSPFNEKGSQSNRNNEAHRYKIMCRLTIALVFLNLIIIIIAFTVAALLLNQKFKPQ